jgi:hypothetical protein
MAVVKLVAVHGMLADTIWRAMHSASLQRAASVACNLCILQGGVRSAMPAARHKGMHSGTIN